MGQSALSGNRLPGLGSYLSTSQLCDPEQELNISASQFPPGNVMRINVVNMCKSLGKNLGYNKLEWMFASPLLPFLSLSLLSVSVITIIIICSSSLLCLNVLSTFPLGHGFYLVLNKLAQGKCYFPCEVFSDPLTRHDLSQSQSLFPPTIYVFKMYYSCFYNLAHFHF